MDYPASKIPRKLSDLANKEDLAYHIAEPGNRYAAFGRLVIDCNILLELYPISDQQKADIRLKQWHYAQKMKTADAILQRRAKEKYGPFCVVMHDHIGAICEDKEAIQANARRLYRFISGDNFIPTAKPETKTNCA